MRNRDPEKLGVKRAATLRVPAGERWLYNGPKAMRALCAGLESAAEKPPKSLGSFAKYARDSDD